MTNRGFVGFPTLPPGQFPGWGMRSGSWYSIAGSATTTALTANALMSAPFFVSRQTAFSAIGLGVTGAGAGSSVVRLGVYADATDGVGGYPGQLVLEAGTIPGDSIAFSSINIGLTLQPGLYWLAGVAQGGTPTVQVVNGPNQFVGHASASALSTRGGYRQGSVTGSLPAVFSTSVDAQGSAPAIQVKVL